MKSDQIIDHTPSKEREPIATLSQKLDRKIGGRKMIFDN